MNPLLDRRSSRAVFIALAALYLLLPNLIFVTTWLRPWIGFPAAALACYGYLRLVRSSRDDDSGWTLSWRTVAAAFLIALAWAFLAGAGGFVPQSEDYLKHNLLFRDLVRSEWPVTYEAGEGGSFLCYSVGYYLVPAAVAQWVGQDWIGALSFIWLSAGLFLFFGWIAAFQPTHPLRTILIFLCTSGILFVWYVLKRETLINIGGFNVPGLALDPFLRHIGLGNSNYDPFTRVFYQPQHALAGWLGAALLYELTWVKRTPVAALFVWATTLLWSPFTALGLLPIPLLSLSRIPTKAYFEPANIISGGAFLAIVAVYYGAHQRVTEVGAIWSLAPDARWIPFYLLFVATQTLPPVVCVYLIDQRFRVLEGFRAVFWGMVLLLLCLPFYKFGFHSDLRMQASGPAMVFIGLAVATCLCSTAFSLRRPAFISLVAVFLLGALYPATRPIINLVRNKSDQSAANQGAQNLSELPSSGFEFDASDQYLGSKQSFAYRWLLKNDR